MQTDFNGLTLYDVLSNNTALIEPLVDQNGDLFYVEERDKHRGVVGTAEQLTLRVEKRQPVMTRLFDLFTHGLASV